MQKIIFSILFLFPLTVFATDTLFKNKFHNLSKEIVVNGILLESRGFVHDFEQNSEGLGYMITYNGKDCTTSFHVYDANTMLFEEKEDGKVVLKKGNHKNTPINLENIPLETVHAYTDIFKLSPDLKPEPPDFETAFFYSVRFHNIKQEYKDKKSELLNAPPVMALVGQASNATMGVGTTIYKDNFLKVRMSCLKHSPEEVKKTIEESALWLVNELNSKED